MRLQPQCVICLLQWVYGRGSVASGEVSCFKIVSRLLAEASAHVTAGENIASVSNKLVGSMWDIVGDTTTVYYQNLKRACNENAAKLLDSAKEYINREPTTQLRIEKACWIASAGNVAPIGIPSHGFVFNKVKDVLGERLTPFVKGNVFETLRGARKVLYVTDNAGEIGFDSLLISQLKEMGCRVTLLVKEPMFFEDASMEDIRFFGLDKLVNSVLTVEGVFVPKEATPALSDALEAADMVIAKGTGNYEALKGELDDKPVIYMLKVKCAPIAVSTGIDMGRFVIIVDK